MKNLHKTRTLRSIALLALLSLSFVAVAQAPVALEFEGSPYLARIGAGKAVEFRIKATNNTGGPWKGEIVLSPGSQFTSIRAWDQRRLPLDFTQADETKVVSTTHALQRAVGPIDLIMTAQVKGQDQVAHGIARLVEVAVPEDVQAAALSSPDSVVRDMLAWLGVPAKTVSPSGISPDALSDCGVVFVPSEAYEALADSPEAVKALDAYVKQGGALIVLRWGVELFGAPVSKPDASEPSGSGEIVTLNKTVADHPVFSTPNPLEAAPLCGQGALEPGSAFFVEPADVPGGYTPLLEWVDAEGNVTGHDMAFARLGKGACLYMGLPLERALAARSREAIRLLANLAAIRGAL